VPALALVDGQAVNCHPNVLLGSFDMREPGHVSFRAALPADV